METSASAALPAPGISRWALAIAFLGPALAWTAHLLLSWAIAEWGGITGWLPELVFGIKARVWLLIAVTGLTLVAAIASTLIGHACRRRLKSDPRHDAHDAANFIARTGVLHGWLFVFIIAGESLPILFYLQTG
jgi:hypothetical protein